MLEAQEFEKYCLLILEMHFGQLANGFLTKVKMKKDINNRSNISDFKEFIDLIEINISVLAGKNKAIEISNTLRNKIIALENMHNSECNAIQDVQVKNGIGGNRINDEINEFLTRFQKPTKTDIDDFIKYIRLSKYVFKEDEIREEIEKEKLYRKFHGPKDEIITTEINELENLLKNPEDKKDAPKRKMRKQELTYLIKDESGVPDKSVSEMVKLMTPTEKDTKETLEELGFKHLIADSFVKHVNNRVPYKKSSGLKHKKFHIGNSDKI